MSLKTRFVAFATTLAAVGALSVAATSAASAETTCEAAIKAGKISPESFCDAIENFEVSGTLTDKKLNQSVELKEGTFNGYVDFTGFFPFVGTINGVTAAKPFEAPIKLFGLTTKVGLTFTQVGESNGVVDQIEPKGSPNCETNPGEACLHESIPTSANLGFTSIELFGLKLPLHCKTSKPVSLPLEENLQLAELLNPFIGSHFTGTTTFPSISCNFFEEPLTALFNSVLLTSLFSGPGNTYSLFVKA